MANYSNLIILNGPNLGLVMDIGSAPSITTDAWESGFIKKKGEGELEIMCIKVNYLSKRNEQKQSFDYKQRSKITKCIKCQLIHSACRKMLFGGKYENNEKILKDQVRINPINTGLFGSL